MDGFPADEEARRRRNSHSTPYEISGHSAMRMMIQSIILIVLCLSDLTSRRSA
jgi:hypothetical protein